MSKPIIVYNQSWGGDWSCAEHVCVVCTNHVQYTVIMVYDWSLLFLYICNSYKSADNIDLQCISQQSSGSLEMYSYNREF